MIKLLVANTISTLASLAHGSVPFFCLTNDFSISRTPETDRYLFHPSGATSSKVFVLVLSHKLPKVLPTRFRSWSLINRNPVSRPPAPASKLLSLCSSRYFFTDPPVLMCFCASGSQHNLGPNRPLNRVELLIPRTNSL